MPWSNLTLTRLREGERREPCTCPHAKGAEHAAEYRMAGRHTDDAGRRTGADVVFLCTNAAAAAAHLNGIKGTFNPEGEKS